MKTVIVSHDIHVDVHPNGKACVRIISDHLHLGSLNSIGGSYSERRTWFKNCHNAARKLRIDLKDALEYEYEDVENVESGEAVWRNGGGPFPLRSAIEELEAISN